jgi:hypothetical protein
VTSFRNDVSFGTSDLIGGCSNMTKVHGVDALEAIVQEAVARNGDNWGAVSADIRANLASLPENCRVDINKQLQTIVDGAGHSAATRRLH